MSEQQTVSVKVIIEELGNRAEVLEDLRFIVRDARGRHSNPAEASVASESAIQTLEHVIEAIELIDEP